ncbi:MAG: Zn-dependent hydrolase of the beta-lactamase fold-like protein [Amycolatopsis sp.]|uniref:MBL fold metallo-hydrolase n=1 Tax=Amycolatopsis sp. TaxID=37632 RepID=UPI00262FE1C4|nr:MBL fold metallo-hydrolase [Amycolatopsis sp.]MCU1687490.1 Zn-dependent hydrolase of the beta-lactamase fold-like protein [Amycolatopsis sp.]
MAEPLRVTFVGGPTAILEIGGLRLLTDPTFSAVGSHGPRGLTKTEEPGVARQAVGRIDAVLLSHDEHADNLDPGGRELLAEVPLTLTTPGGASRLGGTAQGLEPWEQVRVGELLITATPALHGPEGCEPITGVVTGFLVQGDGATVYVSGDNASLDLVRSIAERTGPIDVALLFAGAARTSLFDGAPLTLTSADAAEATRILGVRQTVALHTRGWAHFSEGPDVVRKAFADAGLIDRLRLLNPGETAEL